MDVSIAVEPFSFWMLVWLNCPDILSVENQVSLGFESRAPKVQKRATQYEDMFGC